MLERREQIIGPERFRHRQGLARQRAGVQLALAGGEGLDHVGHVQDADDGVKVVRRRLTGEWSFQAQPVTA